jgi:uncharacterized protein
LKIQLEAAGNFGLENLGITITIDQAAVRPTHDTIIPVLANSDTTGKYVGGYCWQPVKRRFSHLSVNPANQKQGIGTELLRHAIATWGMPITLVPRATGSIPQQKLEAWYKKHGFEFDSKRTGIMTLTKQAKGVIWLRTWILKIEGWLKGFSSRLSRSWSTATELAGAASVRKDYVNALSIYRPLANKGNAVAQTRLGVMYQNGRGVPQDYAEAARLYRLAADQGMAPAQAELGVMYFRGEGVPQNDAEAVRLYRLAAQQDYAAAEMMLGLTYRDGLAGVTQNYAEAVKWYTPAAEQGLPEAQLDLGVLYLIGEGVPQDYVRAHMWLNLSAAQGNEKAIKYRDKIVGQMTPEQIAEAQKLASEWKPRNPKSKSDAKPK